jgi:hypothetical protein
MGGLDFSEDLAAGARPVFILAMMDDRQQGIFEMFGHRSWEAAQAEARRWVKSLGRQDRHVQLFGLVACGSIRLGPEGTLIEELSKLDE